MSFKEILSAIAIALTFIAFLPYIRSIHRGQTRPHVFSWIIWGTTTSIVFFAQIADDGGAGAWPIGVSGLITFYVAVLAFARRGNDMITRTDWRFFGAALVSLPIWFVTRDPVWAVIILTLVDIIGLGPTLRKAWDRPHEEQSLFFALIASRDVLVILALENYSLTTVLFPFATGLGCIAVVAILTWRRHQ